jgi:gamma-glutamyltranspeptidase/glutathione hydrolase
VPIERLLSKAHAAEWRRRIATGEPIRIPIYEKEAAGTTHISVVDAQGNVAAITHSLGWTSGLVCPGLGFMYNNALSRYDPLPGSPNSIAPGRARRTGMCPTVVARDGEPVLVVGAPGGTRIFTAVLQTIVNVLDHGLTPTEAVSAPRFDCQTAYLDAESRIPTWIKRSLGQRGFRIFPNPSALSSLAYVQAITRDPISGALAGGSDPRGGGCVLGTP